jgi:hypothetical protein
VLLALPALLPSLLPHLAVRGGVELELGRASYAFPGPALRLQGLRVGPGPGVLVARDLRLEPDLPALLGGELRLSRLAVSGGRLALARDADGALVLSGAGWRPGALLSLPVDALDLQDVEVALPFDLPPLQVRSLLAEVSTHADGATGLAGRVTLALGDSEAGLQGRAGLRDGAVEGAGEVSLARFDLGRLAPLWPGGSAVAPAGVLEGAGRLSLGEGAAGGRRLTLDAALSFIGLARDAGATSFSDARGTWDGELGLALGPEGDPRGLQASGRLVLDGASVAGGAGAGRWRAVLEGAFVQGHGEVGAAASGPALDCDGEASRASVLEGPWAGVSLDGVAVWGARYGRSETLSIGQLRVGRLELPRAGRVEGLVAAGVGVAAEGATVDRLTAGPVTLAFPASPAPLSIGAVEAAEAMLTERWGRLGTLDVQGVVLRGSGARPELALERASLAGPRYAAGEPLHLGEVRLSGLALEVVRDAAGSWRLPAAGLPVAAGVTLDALIVRDRSRIEVSDPTTDPPARMTVEDLQGRIAGRDGGRSGRFSLTGRVGDGGHVALGGELGRPGSPLPGPLRAEATGVPLSVLAPYLEAALGAGLGGGTLDARLAIAPPRGEIVGPMRLTLTRAEVPPQSGGEPARLVARALALLEDARGTVSLEVPAPAPGRGAVEQALASLAAAVASAYRPLDVGEAEAATLLAQGVLALKVLRSARGGAPVDVETAAFLERLAAAVAPRPRTGVLVCRGRPVAAGPALEVTGPAAEDAPVQAVADVLVRRLGLPSTRVVGCRPDAGAGEGDRPVVVGLVALP